MKKAMQSDAVRYVVRGKHDEVPGVCTLRLSMEDGTSPPFAPGQYINVYFSELRTPEGKAYSISSAPGEPTFSITIRAIGEFSNRLCSLAPGETVSASLPYGFFSPEGEGSDLVMIAAGIGVTPFRSMLQDAAARAPSRRMALFHTIRTSDDALFEKEFAALGDTLADFSLSRFVTREAAPSLPSARQGRMTAHDVLSAVPSANAEFLVCGSIPFTRDMWRALRAEGVSEDKIYTEAFFSR
ncbi:hypothetical protein KW797_03370 [Candidatus Parcubacteria bacterium]|nr:hypothetical protein [Candidatus Parcubacteria bacterium]